MSVYLIHSSSSSLSISLHTPHFLCPTHFRPSLTFQFIPLFVYLHKLIRTDQSRTTIHENMRIAEDHGERLPPPTSRKKKNSIHLTIIVQRNCCSHLLYFVYLKTGKQIAMIIKDLVLIKIKLNNHNNIKRNIFTGILSTHNTLLKPNETKNNYQIIFLSFQFIAITFSLFTY